MQHIRDTSTYLYEEQNMYNQLIRKTSGDMCGFLFRYKTITTNLNTSDEC